MSAARAGFDEIIFDGIDRIAAIPEATGIFMTLHSGSTTHHEDFRKAAKAGMSIVHVGTEIRLAWRGSMETALASE